MISGEEVDLARGDAVVAHVRGQLRLGLALAHLGEQLVGVGVGAEGEVDVQGRLAVVGVDRVHVVHVVDAGHLLLDRGGHRLFDGQRVGAGVGALDLDLRRNDVRELGGRQPGHGDQADDGHQDRDDHGHDRPVDEELGHGALTPWRPAQAPPVCRRPWPGWLRRAPLALPGQRASD
jgi:hypothetical protein